MTHTLNNKSIDGVVVVFTILEHFKYYTFECIFFSVVVVGKERGRCERRIYYILKLLMNTNLGIKLIIHFFLI